MKRTSSQMQEICQPWEQSGLSRREFCKQNNIAYQTFNYWYKRITKKAGYGFSQISLPVNTLGNGFAKTGYGFPIVRLSLDKDEFQEYGDYTCQLAHCKYKIIVLDLSELNYYA